MAGETQGGATGAASDWIPYGEGIWINTETGETTTTDPNTMAAGDTGGAGAGNAPPNYAARRVTDAAAPAPTRAELLATIAGHESGGDYGAASHSSSAAGKYQIIKGTAREIAQDSGADLAPFAREVLSGPLTAPDAPKEPYQEWLAFHPGVQEQLANHLVTKLSNGKLARAQATPHEAARQVFTDWNFGPNTDMADNTPVPNNSSAAERAAAFDKRLAEVRGASAAAPATAGAPGPSAAVSPFNPNVAAAPAGTSASLDALAATMTPDDAAPAPGAGEPPLHDAAGNPIPPANPTIPPGVAQRFTQPETPHAGAAPIPGAPAGFGVHDQSATPPVMRGATSQATRANGSVDPTALHFEKQATATPAATPADPNADLRTQIQTRIDAFDQALKNDANVSSAMMKQINDKVAEIGSGKLDPRRIFSHRGGAVVLAAISNALGAAGATLGHGQNEAGLIIQHALDQDLAAQKAEMDTRENALGHMVKAAGSYEEGVKGMRMLQYEVVKSLVDELGKGGASSSAGFGAGQVGSKLADLSALLASSHALESQEKKLGIFSGMQAKLPAGTPVVGSPDAVEFDRRSKELVADVVNALSGAAASDKERAYLSSLIPSASTTKGTAKADFTAFNAWINRKFKALNDAAIATYHRDYSQLSPDQAAQLKDATPALTSNAKSDDETNEPAGPEEAE